MKVSIGFSPRIAFCRRTPGKSARWDTVHIRNSRGHNVTFPPSRLTYSLGYRHDTWTDKYVSFTPLSQSDGWGKQVAYGMKSGCSRPAVIWIGLFMATASARLAPNTPRREPCARSCRRQQEVDATSGGASRPVALRHSALVEVPAACLTGDQFNPSIVVSHKPVLEDSLKPPALGQLSGRNGGQFIKLSTQPP
jgi:hypothetical protein